MTGPRPLLSAASLIASLALPTALPGQSRDWVRPPAKEGYSYPDCYCTNRGERVEMGGLVCLEVGGSSYLARCEMSLNNPMWRKVRDGCPSARLTPSLQRAGEDPDPG